MLAAGELIVAFALGVSAQAEFDNYLQFEPANEREAVVEIRCDRPVGRQISPLLFGKFTEHLGRNMYLGMWSQLLVNPGFERAKFWGKRAKQINKWLGRYFETPELPAEAAAGLPPAWMRSADKTAKCSLTEDAYSGDTALRVIVPAGRKEPAGVLHPLYMPTRRVLLYDWSLALKCDNATGLLVRLRTRDGSILATERKEIPSGDWKVVRGQLNLPGSAKELREVCYFELLFTKPGSYWLDQVLVWPGDSVDGWDPDVLAMVRESRLPLLRWPGGNFASGYHWRDGIGPLRTRPIRLNRPWNMPEPNHIGTDEFMRFCELAGCTPMICVNAGNGTAKEAADWVEYCNGPVNTPLGRLRAKHGHPEPYGVKYWEIGNELYGRWQIGHCDAHEYARRYRQFVTLMKKRDAKIRCIANGHNLAWNKVLINGCHDILSSVSLHTLIGGGIPPQADPANVWRLVVGYPWGYRDYLMQLSDQLRAKVPEGTIAITELQIFTNRPNLPNNASIAEALFWAGVVHTAVRLGDRIELITHSALVNHGGGLRKVRELVYATPVYYARKMYATQPGKWPVLVRTKSPTITEPRLHNLPAVRNTPLIDLIALLDDSGKQLALLIINRSGSKPIRTRFQLRGFKPAEQARWTWLAGDNIMAANTFENPEAVVPDTRSLALPGSEFSLAIPARSVSVLLLQRR